MTESYYIASNLSMECIGGNNPARSKYQGVGRTYEAFTNYCGWSAQEAGKTMGLAPYGQDKFPGVQLYEINDELQICSRVNGKYLDAAVNFCKENGVDFGQPGQGFDNKDAAFFVQDRTERIITDLSFTGMSIITLISPLSLTFIFFITFFPFLRAERAKDLASASWAPPPMVPRHSPLRIIYRYSKIAAKSA